MNSKERFAMKELKVYGLSCDLIFDNLMVHFKPNLFIPGAAKSGTTTLHNLLNNHPDICMSSNKEPVYWNNAEFDNLNDYCLMKLELNYEKYRHYISMID